MRRPEDAVRADIDAALAAAGWAAQDRATIDLDIAIGAVVREFPFRAGHGFANHPLRTSGQAAGVVEAKEAHPKKYTAGSPESFSPSSDPLQRPYQPTDVEPFFSERETCQGASERGCQCHHRIGEAP